MAKFQADADKFYIAQNYLIDANSILKGKRSNITSCTSSYPEGYEYSGEVSSLCSTLTTVINDISKLERKVSETKEKLMASFTGWSTTYFETALSNYKNFDNTLALGDEYVNYINKQYDTAEYNSQLRSYYDTLVESGDFEGSFEQFKIMFEYEKDKEELAAVDKELNDLYDNPVIRPNIPGGRITETQAKAYKKASEDYENYKKRIRELEERRETLQISVNGYEISVNSIGLSSKELKEARKKIEDKKMNPFFELFAGKKKKAEQEELTIQINIYNQLIKNAEDYEFGLANDERRNDPNFQKKVEEGKRISRNRDANGLSNPNAYDKEHILGGYSDSWAYERYMSQEDIDMYYYILATNNTYDEFGLWKGYDAGLEYLKKFDQEVNNEWGKELGANQKAAYEKANWVGKTAMTLGISAQQGISSYFEGVSISTDKLFGVEDIDTTVKGTSVAAGIFRENLGDVAGKVYDINQVNTHMLPSMSLGLIGGPVGQIASTVSIYSSSYGNKYKEMVNQGYSDSQASDYALMSAAAETALEKLFSAVPGIGVGAGTPQLTYKTLVADRVKDVLVDAGGEVLQDTASKYIGNELLNQNNDLSLFTEENMNTFLISLASSITLGGGGTVSNAVDIHKTRANLVGHVYSATGAEVSYSDLMQQVKKGNADNLYAGFSIMHETALDKVLETVDSSVVNDMVSNVSNEKAGNLVNVFVTPKNINTVLSNLNSDNVNKVVTNMDSNVLQVIYPNLSTEVQNIIQKSVDGQVLDVKLGNVNSNNSFDLSRGYSLEELSNLLQDNNYTILGHGTGGNNVSVIAPIMENGLRCSHTSLLYTSVGLNTNNLNDLQFKLNNWQHQDSENIILMRLPNKYFNMRGESMDLNCERTGAFVNEVVDSDGNVAYYLDPKFIIGSYNRNTGLVTINSAFEENLSEQTIAELDEKYARTEEKIDQRLSQTDDLFNYKEDNKTPNESNEEIKSDDVYSWSDFEDDLDWDIPETNTVNEDAIQETTKENNPYFKHRDNLNSEIVEETTNDIDSELGVYDELNINDELRTIFMEQRARFDALKGVVINNKGLVLDSNGKAVFQEGTLYHGTSFDFEKLSSIAETGILTGQAYGISEDGETYYCADFYRISEDTSLSDYNSALPNTFDIARRTPFTDHNLSKDRIAFVIQPSNEISDLLSYDAYRDGTTNGDTTGEFVVELPSENHSEAAAILYGTPSEAISGIVVGDNVAQSIEKIEFLKTEFPGCYIVTKNGDVIYNPSVNNQVVSETLEVDNKTKAFKLSEKYKTNYETNEIFRELYDEWDSTGFISEETAAMLEDLLNDSEEYYIGIHRTGEMKAETIIDTGGLILTGHDGVSMDSPNLELNISYQKDLFSFIIQLKTAGFYKTSNGVGDVLFYKIPKNESVDNITYIGNDGQFRVKNEYLVGYTTVDNFNVGEIKTINHEFNEYLNVNLNVLNGTDTYINIGDARIDFGTFSNTIRSELNDLGITSNNLSNLTAEQINDLCDMLSYYSKRIEGVDFVFNEVESLLNDYQLKVSELSSDNVIDKASLFTQYMTDLSNLIAENNNLTIEIQQTIENKNLSTSSVNEVDYSFTNQEKQVIISILQKSNNLQDLSVLNEIDYSDKLILQKYLQSGAAKTLLNLNLEQFNALFLYMSGQYKYINSYLDTGVDVDLGFGMKASEAVKLIDEVMFNNTLDETIILQRSASLKDFDGYSLNELPGKILIHNRNRSSSIGTMDTVGTQNGGVGIGTDFDTAKVKIDYICPEGTRAVNLGMITSNDVEGEVTIGRNQRIKYVDVKMDGDTACVLAVVLPDGVSDNVDIKDLVDAETYEVISSKYDLSEPVDPVISLFNSLPQMIIYENVEIPSLDLINLLMGSIGDGYLTIKYGVSAYKIYGAAKSLILQNNNLFDSIQISENVINKIQNSNVNSSSNENSFRNLNRLQLSEIDNFMWFKRSDGSSFGLKANGIFTLKDGKVLSSYIYTNGDIKHTIYSEQDLIGCLNDSRLSTLISDSLLTEERVARYYTSSFGYVGYIGEQNGNLIKYAFKNLGKKILAETGNQTWAFFNNNRNYQIGQFAVGQEAVMLAWKNQSNIEHLISKLDTFGFNKRQSYEILSGINSIVGVCGYADLCNCILDHYKNNESAFYNDFGFEMFITDNQGVRSLNTSELLLDMFVVMNTDISGQDSLFVRKGNEIIFNKTKEDGTIDWSKNQFPSLTTGKNINLINTYLKSKNPNLTFNSETIFNSTDNAYLTEIDIEKLTPEQINDLINVINNAIIDGKQVSLGMENSPNNSLNLRFFDVDNNFSEYQSTDDWSEGKDEFGNVVKDARAGHTVFVTYVNDEGLFCATWGKNTLMKWEDLTSAPIIISINEITDSSTKINAPTDVNVGVMPQTTVGSSISITDSNNSDNTVLMESLTKILKEENMVKLFGNQNVSSITVQEIMSVLRSNNLLSDVINDITSFYNLENNSLVQEMFLSLTAEELDNLFTFNVFNFLEKLSNESQEIFIENNIYYFNKHTYNWLNIKDKSLFYKIFDKIGSYEFLVDNAWNLDYIDTDIQIELFNKYKNDIYNSTSEKFIRLVKNIKDSKYQTDFIKNSPFYAELKNSTYFDSLLSSIKDNDFIVELLNDSSVKNLIINYAHIFSNCISKLSLDEQIEYLEIAKQKILNLNKYQSVMDITNYINAFDERLQQQLLMDEDIIKILSLEDMLFLNTQFDGIYLKIIKEKMNQEFNGDSARILFDEELYSIMDQETKNRAAYALSPMWYSTKLQNLNVETINVMIDKCIANNYSELNNSFDGTLLYLYNAADSIGKQKINDTVPLALLFKTVSAKGGNVFADLLVEKLKQTKDINLNRYTKYISEFDSESYGKILEFLNDGQTMKSFNYKAVVDLGLEDYFLDVFRDNPTEINNMNIYKNEVLNFFKLLESSNDIQLFYDNLDVDTISYMSSLNDFDNLDVQKIKDILLSKLENYEFNGTEYSGFQSLLSKYSIDDQIEILNSMSKVDRYVILLCGLIDNSEVRLNMIDSIIKDSNFRSYIEDSNFATFSSFFDKIDNETVNYIIDNATPDFLGFMLTLTKRNDLNAKFTDIINNNTLILNKYGKDAEYIYEHLSEENKEIINNEVNSLLNSVNNKNVSILLEDATIAQKSLFLEMFNKYELNDEKIEMLIDIKNKNKFVLSTFNYALFDDDLYQLGKDSITKLSRYYDVVDQIVELKRDLNKFKLFVELIKNDNSSSFIVSDQKMALILDYLLNNNCNNEFFNYTNQKELDVVKNLILKDIDHFAIIGEENRERSILTLENYSLESYDQQLDAKCDEMLLSATSVSDVQNLIFNKYFSLCIEDVNEMFRIYGEYFNKVKSFDNEGIATVYLENLYNILNVSSIEEAIDLYKSLDCKYTMTETLDIINSIKKTYTRSLKSTLYQLEDVSYYVDYNGSSIPVYELTDNFQMLIHSTAAYGSAPLINDDYFQTWNMSNRTQNHGICCSLVSNNNMGLPPVHKGGIIYGFNSFSDEQINLGAPYDIYTHNDGYLIQCERPIKYLSGTDIMNETRHTHNEFNLERMDLTGESDLANIQPDFVVIEESMSDEFKQSAYKAASEMGIPIVHVNLSQLAQSESNKIDNLINDFYDSGNVELAKEVLILHENNRSGYRVSAPELVKEYFSSEKIIDFLNKVIECTDSKDSLNQIKEFLLDELRKFDDTAEATHRVNIIDIPINDLIQKVDEKIN